MVPSELLPLLPENWLDDLAEWVFPTTSIQLSEDDARCLGAFSTEYCRIMGVKRTDFFSDDLLSEIDAVLEETPEGVMPRTSWCSWKASLIGNYPCQSMNELLKTITTDDRRIGYGLAAMLVGEVPVYLHLRAWRNILPEHEFRIFVQEGEVIGLSQYHWRETYPAMLEESRAIALGLRQALTDILPLLPTKTCVLDLAINKGVTRVIELNPFSRETDACLFSWKEPGSFDGSLRLRNSGQIIAIRPEQL